MVIAICVAFFITLVFLAIAHYRIDMNENNIAKLLEDNRDLRAAVSRGEQYIVTHRNSVYSKEVPLNVVIRAIVDHLGLELDIIPPPRYNGLTIKKKAK